MALDFSTAPCGHDPDDDHVRITVNGEPLGPDLWPSEAATIVSWLEKTVEAGLQALAEGKRPVTIAVVQLVNEPWPEPAHLEQA